MNKKMILTGLLGVTLAVGSANAGFGFGFSVSDNCGPNVGFGISVPFDNCCGPRAGFGFSVPVYRPVVYQPVHVVRPARVIVRTVQVHRDSEGSKFWRINNDTNKTIIAINGNGKKISIRPGGIGKLSHALGFELKIRFAGNNNEYAVVERKGHELTVKHRGGILVFDDYEFFDDADDFEMEEDYKD